MNGHNDIKPLSSKGTLNRMANTNHLPLFFSENKGIREEYEWDEVMFILKKLCNS